MTPCVECGKEPCSAIHMVCDEAGGHDYRKSEDEQLG